MNLFRIILLVFTALFLIASIGMLAVNFHEAVPSYRAGAIILLAIVGYSLSFTGIYHRHFKLTMIGGCVEVAAILANVHEIHPFAFLVPLSVLNYGMMLRKQRRV